MLSDRIFLIWVVRYIFLECVVRYDIFVHVLSDMICVCVVRYDIFMYVLSDIIF